MIIRSTSLEFSLNGIERCFLGLVFFFNAIIVNDGSDKHIFNILCTNFASCLSSIEFGFHLMCLNYFHSNET
jgi:hypothetical protein